MMRRIPGSSRARLPELEIKVWDFGDAYGNHYVDWKPFLQDCAYSETSLVA